jgi:hypothetical protein
MVRACPIHGIIEMPAHFRPREQRQRCTVPGCTHNLATYVNLVDYALALTPKEEQLTFEALPAWGIGLYIGPEPENTPA